MISWLLGNQIYTEVQESEHYWPTNNSWNSAAIKPTNIAFFTSYAILQRLIRKWDNKSEVKYKVWLLVYGERNTASVRNQMYRHPSLDSLLFLSVGKSRCCPKGKSWFSYNLSSSPIWNIWNAQGSNVMLSASRFTESNRTVDRYLSPKLGKTACTKQKWLIAK